VREEWAFVPSEEGIRHWFPPGDPVATAVAMLCILREDLLLELLGIVSDGLPKLDDNSTGYRRTYLGMSRALLNLRTK
jgi:hypothetical protein